MAATVDSQPVDGAAEVVSISNTGAGRHFAIDGRRFSRAEGLLASLAIVSFGLVFMRLFERWRVTPHAVSHRVAILGHQLSYPIGNLAAIVVLALALFGSIVVTIAIAGATRELRATIRAGRHLAAGHRRAIKGALVIDDVRPQAFCVGLLRPRVCVTTGAVAALDEQALEAVLSHERHHARRRDPLRLAASRVLAQALFFLPGLRELGRRREIVSEISADESAIKESPANRSALARAMLKFTESADADDSAGIDPSRVDHLLGESPTWRFPALLFVLAAFLLALLAAVAVLAGQEAAGSASLAPPFLSAQPCIVILALIPVALALVAIGAARSKRFGPASSD